jgi:hypothetical protein
MYDEPDGNNGSTWILPRCQAGNRRERHRTLGNPHLTHVAESTVSDTGTSPRDDNGSDGSLGGNLEMNPQTPEREQSPKWEAPNSVLGTKRRVGSKTM